jgi:hypothetical protein
VGGQPFIDGVTVAVGTGVGVLPTGVGVGVAEWGVGVGVAPAAVGVGVDPTGVGVAVAPAAVGVGVGPPGVAVAVAPPVFGGTEMPPPLQLPSRVPVQAKNTRAVPRANPFIGRNLHSIEGKGETLFQAMDNFVPSEARRLPAATHFQGHRTKRHPNEAALGPEPNAPSEASIGCRSCHGPRNAARAANRRRRHEGRGIKSYK